MPALQVKRVSSSQLCSPSHASPAFGSMPDMRGSTRTSITFEPTEVVGLHSMASALGWPHARSSKALHCDYQFSAARPDQLRY